MTNFSSRWGVSGTRGISRPPAPRMTHFSSRWGGSRTLEYGPGNYWGPAPTPPGTKECHPGSRQPEVTCYKFGYFDRFGSDINPISYNVITLGPYRHTYCSIPHLDSDLPLIYGAATSVCHLVKLLITRESMGNLGSKSGKFYSISYTFVY